jgi:hypothetical protein
LPGIIEQFFYSNKSTKSKQIKAAAIEKPKIEGEFNIIEEI